MKREESIYQHLLIILLANGALVVGQAMFFTLMVDNHRVATIAATEYQHSSVSSNQSDGGSGSGRGRGRGGREENEGERPLISQAGSQ
jgi:hypothetical protein